MSQLFRLPGALPSDPAVASWIREHDDDLGTIARRWFDAMRACGDDVREVVHDGYPTACVSDAAFAYVGAFTAHVNVGFFHGADLDDPAALLEGTGKRMRHVKVRPGRALDDTALEALVRAAYRDVKNRLRVGEPTSAGTRGS